MTMITEGMRKQLAVNGDAQATANREGRTIDFKPVVKLFTPDASATWLLTEVEPSDPDIAFGLCDVGQGFPEVGTVRLSELAEVRGRLKLPIERDRFFDADKTLSQYATDARTAGYIAA